MERLGSVEKVWLSVADENALSGYRGRQVLVAHESGRPYEAVALVDGALVLLKAANFNRESQVHHGWSVVRPVNNPELLAFLRSAEQFF